MTFHVPGVVKFALLLWRTRHGQGVLASEILQQGNFRSHYPHLVLLQLMSIFVLVLLEHILLFSAGSAWQLSVC
jgi:hypothetical protein